MSSLSSEEKLTASPCVPSLNVVSNVNTRIKTSFGKVGRDSSRPPSLRYSRLFLLLQKRHHLPQLRADLFDLLRLRRFPHLQKILAARLVLANPLPGELARLDLAQNLLHLLAGFFRNHPRTARVIAIFRRIRNRVAHIAEPALLNEIDNQLQFV